MLGIAKGAVGGSAQQPVNDATAFITPSNFATIAANGSYTSPFFNAQVSGGVGPFTYSWSSTIGNILSETASKTRIVVSGYNTEVFGEISVTVTDTGNSNKQATANTTFRVYFEDRIR